MLAMVLSGWSIVPALGRATVPVDDFFVPFFDATGRRTWDVGGGDATVDRESGCISIRDIRVRLFDFLENSAFLTLSSPQAEFSRDKNCIVGENFIHVVGHLFTAVGGSWMFFGADRSVVLENNVQVFFETNLAKSLAPDGERGDGGFTAITAESLQITGSDDGFVLEFSQNVVVQASDLLLSCDRLVVETAFERPVAMLDKTAMDEAIRRIIGDGHVRCEESGRCMEAEWMELFPREGLMVLSGKVSIADENGVVLGQRIVVRKKELHVLTASDGTVHRDICLEME
jgi:lipopolysaccharide export system protein LptA